MLYYGLHWSEQFRVATAIMSTNEQQRESHESILLALAFNEITQETP